jgi:uncharacterized SAM-binding protein YcdF (DUF218 family)
MTTYQNALYSAPILRQHRLQRRLLVTSAMHMPRAAATHANTVLAKLSHTNWMMA